MVPIRHRAMVPTRGRVTTPTPRTAAALLAALACAGERLPAALTALDEAGWRALLQRADDEDMLSLAVARVAPAAICPDALLAEFAPRVAQRRQWSALRIRQMHEIVGGLSAAGVAVRTIKGFALGQDLYGDALLRDSHDLDLIVAPADAAASARWLAGKGYAPACDLQWFADAGFLAGLREAGFASLGGVLEVDLHWRIAQPWLPAIVRVEPLLAAAPHALAVAGHDVAWHARVDVAALQAANLINGWDTELRSVVDWTLSLRRLSADERSQLRARFAATGSDWVWHTLVTLAQHVCGGGDGELASALPPSDATVSDPRVSSTAVEMANEALDGGSARRQDNRRFVRGVRSRWRLAAQRLRPGLADYAAAAPGHGAVAVGVAATRRRLALAFKSSHVKHKSS